jgi:transcription initiation factor TFIIIB Brf1 subunit/transcription initiation factor TFIIB
MMVMSLEERMAEVLAEQEVPKEVIESAYKILEEYEYKGGQAPSSLAAGALYLAWLSSSSTPPGQSEIAAWFGRSEATLRIAKREFINHFGQERLNCLLN